MYLRRVRSGSGCRYVIRESFEEDGCWKHQDVMDLGSDPCEFIVYPGGNGFYFKDELEETLSARGVDYSSSDLEDLFFPFLEPHIRRIIANFRNGSGCGRNPRNSLDEEEIARLQGQLHPIDKRRLHFLRCGRVDIGRLDGRRSWGFLNVLIRKSRDEIEHVMEEMELHLRPKEVRNYLFTAFHLQSYFSGNILRNQPGALDARKVDECFLEELCSLNRDSRFFRGVGGRAANELHPYLTRYVIMYFDHDFDRAALWSEYIAEAMRQRFSGRAGRSAPGMQVAEACTVLGVSPDRFPGMSRQDLTKHYRRKAKDAHPDSGGDHEAFVRITEAYEVLLLRKK